MKIVNLGGLSISLPMPVLVVVEDVGWWRGEDGSGQGQPYRNGFSRDHCLADYHALVRLSRALGMRVVIGMVLGEWDCTNLLRQVPGATWQGELWDNSGNLGPHLDEAAAYLSDHQRFFELACHGLCHEFWQDGTLSRSEFHDKMGVMRAEEVVRRHLAAYAEILAINRLPPSPRVFLPPALCHGFGAADSMQKLLGDFGYDTVITSFSRMHCRREPQSPWLAWEHGVRLVERGNAPVPWHVAAATPEWDFAGPILALHWSNLLHHQPSASSAVVDGWVDLVRRGTGGLDRLLAADLQACWDQLIVWSLAEIACDDDRAIIDLRRARAVPGYSGRFLLKSLGPPGVGLFASDARIGKVSCPGKCQVAEVRSDAEMVILSTTEGSSSAC